jgi:SNF2 family DNA or RNA helicase
MNKDRLMQIFNEDTSGKNHSNGQRVLNNDLVADVEIVEDDGLLCIRGNVISESLFNQYSTNIELDTRNMSIFSTSCSCLDYEKNELKKRHYCCKHLVATFYSVVEELANHPLLSGSEEDESIIQKTNILSVLLGEEKEKDEIRIEVYINRNEWKHDISAEFKIGIKSMGSGGLYILKDISHFLLAYYNNVPISYGKNFTFDAKKQRFSTKDKRLIDFIEKLQSIGGSYKFSSRGANKVVDGKYINIPKYMIRDFFNVVKKHRVYLNEGFFSRPVEAEISFQAPEAEFELKLINNAYILKASGVMPIALGERKDVFLHGMTIYLPDYEFCYKINPYLQVFNEAKTVAIPLEEEEKVLRRLIPELNLLSPNVLLSKNIKDKIVISECSFNFYFDMDNKDIILTVKVKYGSYEFNIFGDCKEKIIYRDSKREVEIISTLRRLGFEEVNQKFYLLMDEEYIFNFFKRELCKIQELGEVFYSENFKGIKSVGSKGIRGDIKSGKYNYFEMGFKIGDIPPQETSDILRAFRDNLKYFRLKNGEFLDLEELELKKFLKLLDVVSDVDIDSNYVEIPRSKGLYLENYIEENNIRYLKGKNELKDIRDKLKAIDKLKFKEPDGLMGSLREYQRVGYNWFKTLDYLGFGGILGDEMGLGKTLQSISFILSNKGSKTLIIAPTSLIYNWISEFEKFAPEVKIAAVNGMKEEREEIIEKREDYDVLITTYNLVRRDIESYKALDFDYCILDEAQNIKNSNSQNAAAVKSLRAKRRFALSGTPIENSLMELWSIFDFIMPGYLYDEKRFSVRYHKKLKENPVVLEELNKLIKPFILRRRKKEVIKELPDKIETSLLVTMEEEQKRIYKTYANYAVELIEKKVKESEFQRSKIEILSYITKLRQLCLDPSVVIQDYTGVSGKIEALVELLQQSIEEGHKILVFSQFTSVLKNIGKRIGEEAIAYSYLDGAVPSEKRMDMVRDFNSGQKSVFLISLKAGGTGLNLTSADIVVHFDPWWNPAVEDQASDRAHRIGQENVVEVIKIIAKGTIEEKIIALQEEKKKLISELMGDELSGGEGFAALSEEEIMGLFEVH